MNKAMQHNIGAFLTGVLAFATTQIVAGGAGDNVYQNGITIDLRLWKTRPRSAVLLVNGLVAGISGGDTATLTVRMADAPGGSSTFTARETQTAVVQTTNDNRMQKFDFDLTGMDDLVRIEWKADLSAASVDTFDGTGVLVLGGFGHTPPTLA